MIFGALAMSFRGTSLKIHWLQSPTKILCSQVFLAPLSSKLRTGKDSSGNVGTIYMETDSQKSCGSGSSFNSLSIPFSVCVNKNLNLLSEKDFTNPLNVPCTTEMSFDESIQLHSSGEDSGYSGNEPWMSSVDYQYSQYSTRSSLGSVFSDPESLRKLSIDSAAVIDNSNKSSDMSLKRRISRNISTSFENRNSMSDLIGFIGDNCQTATSGGSDGCVSRYRRSSSVQDSRSNPEMFRNRGISGDSFLNMSNRSRQLVKRPKLGLAVCITMSEHFENEMEQFCCEHIALFESMLCRLRASAETAYINHRNFLQIMVNAWQSVAKWIQDLFTAPRVHSPIWLNISSGDTRTTKNLAETFIKELSWLLSIADTKNTNFFISTMLTALLTYHLGWVSTIASFKSHSCSQVEEVANEQKAKLTEVSYKHPYNALWAQMGDLYGCIGNPPRISRTIIYGTEKNIIEKLLHVLTYFIRCEEVKRSPKIEVVDDIALEDVIRKKSNTHSKTNCKKSGLTRSPTCHRNLLLTKNISEEHNQLLQTISSEYNEDNIENSTINDIPNVPIHQNPHFVQLRVGNLKMNVETETNKENRNVKSSTYGNIRFTVTTPENVELSVCYSESEFNTWRCDDVKKTVENNFYEKKPEIDIDNGKIIVKKLFSNIKETIKNNEPSVQDMKKVSTETGIQCYEKNNTNISGGIRKSISMSHLLRKQETSLLSEEFDENQRSRASLSDLITTNDFEKCDRFNLKIQKENLSPEEEEKHFELQTKERKNNSSSGVVFVLGDNEALVNIKKSNEDLPNSNSIELEPKIEQQTSKSVNISEERRTTTFCHHHKKHSGVKFNFEKYPQIATNYMKNKNLDLSSYDFLDKSSKFEEYFKFKPSTSAFQVTLPKPDDREAGGISDSCDVCKYCSNTDETRIFQTPSNATELEFETEEDNYPAKPIIATSSSFELESSSAVTTKAEKNFEKKDKSLLQENVLDSKKPEFDLIELPLPSVKENSDIMPVSTVKNTKVIQARSGFIPSLLIGVSDHYIPDMVLQGILSSPKNWEIKLKQDLVLSSHCATLMPIPVENVAIIADMTKWDVKVISSQNYGLPLNKSSGSPIGMSQLVSTMLETVHAMSCSGMSAYECLSYIESKLQEMYLQSETLAAFLLATEFCSLNTVTAALNLSANDIPLLLSVASVHSPQVTRKYGISFR